MPGPDDEALLGDSAPVAEGPWAAAHATDGPDRGVRFTLELVRGGGAEAGRSGLTHRYRGVARSAEGDVPLEAEVLVEDGEVSVDVRAGDSGDTRACELARRAAALVRTAVRSAVVGGQRLPRRVQRWRDG